MPERRVWGEAHAGVPAADALAQVEDALVAGLRLPEGPVVDVHAHLGTDADGHHLDAADLVADMDAHGIARAVCFPANQPGDAGDFAAANAAVARAAAEHPGRVVPFCRVDPAVRAAETMQRAAADGAVGLKLHLVAQRFALDDAACVAAVADATGRGWPVLVHAGFGARPLAAALATLTDAVPGARLILAHGARGDARAVAQLARERDGLWFDTSLAALPDLVALPPERVLFGADRPYGEHATARQLVALAARVAGWTPAQVEGVLWGNAHALLGLAP